MSHNILFFGNNTDVYDALVKLGPDYNITAYNPDMTELTRNMLCVSSCAVVYGMRNELRDFYDIITDLKERMRINSIPLIVAGTPEDVEDFELISDRFPSLKVEWPIDQSTFKSMVDGIINEHHSLTDASSHGATENSRKRVLVIDDDTMLLMMMREMLRDKYDVATAPSGRIAYKFLSNKNADIILLDYEMPEENGPEVMDKLRLNPKTADIPIVFLSGVTDAHKIANINSKRPQGFIPKPVDRMKLIDTIDRLIV